MAIYGISNSLPPVVVTKSQSKLIQHPVFGQQTRRFMETTYVNYGNYIHGPTFRMIFQLQTLISESICTVSVNKGAFKSFWGILFVFWLVSHCRFCVSLSLCCKIHFLMLTCKRASLVLFVTPNNCKFPFECQEQNKT